MRTQGGNGYATGACGARGGHPIIPRFILHIHTKAPWCGERPCLKDTLSKGEVGTTLGRGGHGGDGYQSRGTTAQEEDASQGSIIQGGGVALGGGYKEGIDIKRGHMVLGEDTLSFTLHIHTDAQLCGRKPYHKEVLSKGGTTHGGGHKE